MKERLCEANGGFGPPELWEAGQLAKELGIRLRDIRPIQGVLEEVVTSAGIRYRFPKWFVGRSEAARFLRISRTAMFNIQDKLEVERGPGNVSLFHWEEIESLKGKPLGKDALSPWLQQQKAQRIRRNPRQNSISESSRNESEISTEPSNLKAKVAQLRALMRESIGLWDRLEFRHNQRDLKQEVIALVARELVALGECSDDSNGDNSTPASNAATAEQQVMQLRALVVDCRRVFESPHFRSAQRQLLGIDDLVCRIQNALHSVPDPEPTILDMVKEDLKSVYNDLFGD